MLFKKTVLRAEGGNKILFFQSSDTIPGGKRDFRYHRHTEFEIALIKSGSGIYTIRGKEYKFSEGDIFIISSNELHCITRMNTDKTFHLMNIQFEPRFIWSADNTWFDSDFLKIFFERKEIFENKLSSLNPATKDIRQLLFEMEAEAKEHKEQSELVIKLLLIKLLVTIMRNYDYVKNSNIHFDFKEQSLQSIEKSIIYINENLENNLTLDELAKKANMNRTYFCTIFKKLNGISPWEYITIKRIEKAVGYIKDTDFTMMEIACMCGFNNTANFNRAFKKVTGKVPGDYRNKV